MTNDSWYPQEKLVFIELSIYKMLQFSFLKSTNQHLIKNVFNFTIFIKNDIEFQKFKIKQYYLFTFSNNFYTPPIISYISNAIILIKTKH